MLYREFTKGNKVTLQLVVPEGFREKVMRLAHETLMSGHLGTKKTLDRVVAEFGLEYVEMWLDFANLAIFVKGQFRKVGLVRCFWENCH